MTLGRRQRVAAARHPTYEARWLLAASTAVLRYSAIAQRAICVWAAPGLTCPSQDWQNLESLLFCCVQPVDRHGSSSKNAVLSRSYSCTVLAPPQPNRSIGSGLGAMFIDGAGYVLDVRHLMNVAFIFQADLVTAYSCGVEGRVAARVKPGKLCKL